MHRYVEIEEYIKVQIDKGKLKDGDIIPAETVLATQFNVSRPTVRQAMSNLVNAGYLTRVRGKGSFVSKPKILQESTRFIESYNVEMSKKGLVPRTLVLAMEVLPASKPIAEKLSIKHKEKVIRLKRLRFAVSYNMNKQYAVLLTEVYIPYSIMPKLIEYDFESFSLYEVFEQNGIQLKKVRRELEARLCDEESASLLEVEPNSAVQYVTSTGYLEDGSIVEYSQSVYPADQNKFVVEIIK